MRVRAPSAGRHWRREPRRCTLGKLITSARVLDPGDADRLARILATGFPAKQLAGQAGCHNSAVLDRPDRGRGVRQSVEVDEPGDAYRVVRMIGIAAGRPPIGSTITGRV